MRGRRDHLLALVGRGGDPDLAPRREARELGELAPVGRQRRRVELDVAGDQDVRRAERDEPLAVAPRCARGTDRNSFKQRGDEARRLHPAAERPLADPPVDHRQRRSRTLQFDDHIGPELALRHQRRVGAPMLDEPPHEQRTVERRILMQRARRQALREHGGRGHRSRGHQRGRAHARDALDKGQQHRGFADARAMQPDERPRRTGKAGQAPPLADASRILLAAPKPHRQDRPGQRRRQERGRSIANERQRRRHAGLRSARRDRLRRPWRRPAGAPRRALARPRASRPPSPRHRRRAKRG